jgi:hypothetical protein
VPVPLEAQFVPVDDDSIKVIDGAIAFSFPEDGITAEDALSNLTLNATGLTFEKQEQGEYVGGAWVNMDEVGVETGSIENDEYVGEATITMTPTDGITFNNMVDEVVKSLVMDEDGDLAWDGDKLALKDDIQSCSTGTDGKFVYVATVSNGGASYAWEELIPASGNNF